MNYETVIEWMVAATIISIISVIALFGWLAFSSKPMPRYRIVPAPHGNWAIEKLIPCGIGSLYTRVGIYFSSEEAEKDLKHLMEQ